MPDACETSALRLRKIRSVPVIKGRESFATLPATVFSEIAHRRQISSTGYLPHPNCLVAGRVGEARRHEKAARLEIEGETDMDEQKRQSMIAYLRRKMTKVGKAGKKQDVVK